MTTNPTLTLPPADASLEADAKALRRSLSDLMRLVQFRDRDRICCHDITVSQCYALEAVVLRGSQRLNDLAAHLYLDKSTTSRIVDSLEKKGLVERTTDPSDRRAVQLEATEAGKRLSRLIESELHAESMAALLGLDESARRGVVRVLDLLVSRQAQRVEIDAGCCSWRPASADDRASSRSKGCCGS